MKIKGEVEVFKIMQDGASESVLKESNMVVDGASEVIVDMLTTPYSLKNLAGSESLNPSNFTIQAVSLGKAEKLYGGHPDTSAADTDVIGMHGFYNNRNLSSIFADKNADADLSAFIGARNLGGASSFTPSYELPKDPRPRDTRLENSSKTQVQLYYELSAVSEYPELTTYTALFSPSNTPSWRNASALITPNGHNLNSYYSSSVKSMETLYQGCYAPSSGVNIYIWDTSVTRGAVTETSAPWTYLLSSINTVVSGVKGRYNTVGSMDREGYLVAYPIQNHPASGDTTQGVAVSAATASSLTSVSYTGGGLVDGSTAFIGSPAVCYNFTISSTDLLCLAAYKGFTNIGLWALDAKETFKSEAAPVAWTTPTNNRKYKLFAKKVFSEDLTTINDAVAARLAGIKNYADLTIQWRINFDFGRTF
jgi:hypothetical protein